MDTNARLNPISAALAMEASEQADLQSAIEDGSKSIANQLSRKYPEMYAIPVVQPDDFEAVYQWFLS